MDSTVKGQKGDLLRKPYVYLVNVGANTAHASKARSPIFAGNDNGDRKFFYVPATTENLHTAVRAYDHACLPFLNPVLLPNLATIAHADPDWTNLTYGDSCGEPRL